MNCNAIYHENGQIELSYPIKLRSLPANIQVIIPDELVEMDDVALDATLAEVHAMLGADYHYTASGKKDKDILAEALQEKYCP